MYKTVCAVGATNNLALVPVRYISLDEGSRHTKGFSPKRILTGGILMPSYACTLDSIPVPSAKTMRSQYSTVWHLLSITSICTAGSMATSNLPIYSSERMVYCGLAITDPAHNTTLFLPHSMVARHDINVLTVLRRPAPCYASTSSG